MAKSVRVKTSKTTFKYKSRPSLKQGGVPRMSARKAK
jgi:hypothetical protein